MKSADITALVEAHVETGTPYREIVLDVRETFGLSLPKGHSAAAHCIANMLRNPKHPLHGKARTLHASSGMLQTFFIEQGLPV